MIAGFFISSASAEVPQQLHYNGYLTNAVGDPVDCPDAIQCDTDHDLTFRIYESPDEGAVLWEESHSGVPLFNGSFTLLLGSVTPISAETISGSLWLGIKVNDQPEMSPRQKIVSAAFALRAARSDQAQEAVNATQLGGMDATDYATQTAVVELQTSLSPVATEGLPEDLQDGDDDTLGAMTCGVGMVPKMSAFGTWSCANDESGADAVDTTLSEPEVDAMVANNGYAAQTDLTAVQTDLGAAQSALAELQTSLNNLSASGEAQTTDISALQFALSELQASLTTAQNDIGVLQTTATTLQSNIDAEASTRSSGDITLQDNINTVEAGLTALDASLDPIAKTGLPADLADGDDDTDTLATLTCADGQVAQKLGEGWACADQTSTQLGTTEPAPCDEAAKGSMYLDEATQTLRICDGTAYRKIKICDEVCPDESVVLCNLPVEDSCGTACGGLGTALNPSLCPAASTAECGATILDECGNTCSVTGTATNSDQCATLAPTTVCGTPITDNCSNACGTTGTYCADASFTCVDGACLAFSQACSIQQAEHPTYTTIARDVALCGNQYNTGNFDAACATGWSVCTLTQWNDRYPKSVAPGGTLTSWGANQASRWSGVWNAGAPVNGNTWDCASDCNNGYNPWNSGKYLYNDAKSEILHGSGSCCAWDNTFSAGSSSNMAVYCCRN
jgi:hypothetical protein